MADADRPQDAALVARCRAGDLNAFSEVYRLHATRLYNLAYRMVGREAAEDLVQDMFLTAFRKLETFKGEAALGTWLYRLGMNVCLDRLRSKAAKQELLTGELDESSLNASGSRALPQVARLDLERAIAALPEGARAAFLLHDVEGFDHHEVGRILGIAEGTSKSQVHKARLRIRAFLSQPRPHAVTAGDGSIG
jgi:RNA polymerase sigma-70 factor (ECF subfamily)